MIFRLVFPFSNGMANLRLADWPAILQTGQIGRLVGIHILFYTTIYYMPCDRIHATDQSRSPRAVHITRYTMLSGLMLHDIPRHLTFELDHVRKCTCKVIFQNFIHFLCACSGAGQPSRDM